MRLAKIVLTISKYDIILAIQRGVGKFDLEKIYKTSNHYKVLYSQSAQQILRTDR